VTLRQSWPMHFALPPLFCRYAAASFDKQRQFADLVETFDWRFNMDSGILSFGDRYQWRAQVLGTESEETQTWLWAWANEASKIPPPLLQASLAMKALGEQRLIEELTEPEVPLGKIDGHFFAMLASGVCQANSYYRAPYDGGTAYLLIRDDTFPKNPDPSLRRIASVFPQVIGISADRIGPELVARVARLMVAIEQRAGIMRGNSQPPIGNARSKP
jgi:hypothetical protein